MFHNYLFWIFRIFSLISWILSFATSVLTSPPNKFIREPASTKALILGNTERLFCSANGYPASTYTWLKDGNVLAGHSNITAKFLSITNLNRSHIGWYECIAANEQGAIRSRKAKLSIGYLDAFGRPPDVIQEVPVNAGHAVTLKVPSIDSYPKPNIFWVSGNALIDDHQYKESDEFYKTIDGDLVLFNVQTRRDHGKEYRAKAQNDHATPTHRDSHTFRISVQPNSEVVPLTLVVKPRDTAVSLGDSQEVMLECAANYRSMQSIEISWFRRVDGIEQPVTTTSLKYRNRLLTIYGPRLDDAGIYGCTVSVKDNPAESVKAEATLTLHVAPNPSPPPPRQQTVDFGEDVQMSCDDSAGRPKPTVTWYKNAQDPPTSPRYKLLPNGHITIIGATSNDSGMFQCFVSNVAGSVNYASWLIVQKFAPRITVQPGNVSVITGQEVDVHCPATGAPKPQFVWQRISTGGVTTNLTTAGRISVNEDRLRIRDTKLSDSANYRCTAINIEGKASVTIVVSVLKRTTITLPPRDLRIIKGNTGVLRCLVSSDERIHVTFIWLLENQRIVYNDRVSLQPDGSLEIKEVRSDDIGTYTCYVASTAGNDSRQATLEVIELPASPHIVEIGLTGPDNQSVQITWYPAFDGKDPIQKFIVQYRILNGAPDDRYGWTTASENVAPDLRSFTVTNLRPAATYRIRVKAVNGVGESRESNPSREIQLPEQPPSKPPRGLYGSARSSSSITIQWQPPPPDHWNGVLLGYRLQYRLAGYTSQTQPWAEQDFDEKTLIHTLENRIVFSEYEVRVAALNSKGPGVYSQIIYVRTKEGKPTEAPKAVQAKAISSTEISVTWQPPSAQRINGINLGYKIFSTTLNGTGHPVGDPVVTNVPVDPRNPDGVMTKVVKRLDKFTSYSVAVLCFTGVGDGPANSPPIVVTTNEDVPGMVESFRFNDIRHRSLVVEWQAPLEPNGILTGYVLQYWPRVDPSQLQVVYLDVHTLNSTVTGLEPKTKYTFVLFATTSVGNGTNRTADIESGATPRTPTAPEILSISNFQKRSVFLQFKPGDPGRTSITLWIVQAQIGGNTMWETIFTKHDPDAESLTVDGLSPYTKYRFRLIAENIVNRSEPSVPFPELDQFETPQDRPNQAPNLTLRVLNESAITVRWTHFDTRFWNGPPGGYYIWYSTEKATHDQGKRITVPKPDQSTYVLSYLDQWQIYCVWMHSFNRIGNSPKSSVVCSKTRESVPSAGPSNVSATVISSQSIQVRWGEVPQPERNGLILGYKVRYARADLQSPPKVWPVDGNETRTVSISGLRPYTLYNIQVLAFSRMGDGALSPAVIHRTLSGVPGIPSQAFFPVVKRSFVKLVWKSPVDPNGVITAYRISYDLEGCSVPNCSKSNITTPQLHDDYNEFTVSGLLWEKRYMFTLQAAVGMGASRVWGKELDVPLLTYDDRSRPQPPTNVTAGSTRNSSSVTINWHSPMDDGNSLLRNYSIQYKTTDQSAWTDFPEFISAKFTRYIVRGLKSFTAYRFRIACSNDVGRSDFSLPSDVIETFPSAPSEPPKISAAVPYSRTSVSVKWKPLSENLWNSPQKGRYYKVLSCKLDQYCRNPGDFHSTRTNTTEPTEVSVRDLTAGVDYEFRVQAVNSHGASPASRPIIVYVGEAVPLSGPVNIRAQAVSSKSIRVDWTVPSNDTWNGDLQGFKVYFWMIESASDKHVKRRVKRATTANAFKTYGVRVVSSRANHLILEDLVEFTTYNVTVAAFNMAGDGPNGTVFTIQTLEGVPLAPANLSFHHILPNSLNISWGPPSQVRGLIQKFKIEVFSTEVRQGVAQISSHRFMLPGSIFEYRVTDLKLEHQYRFDLSAKTSIGWGPSVNQNVTISPQPGSPEAPRALKVSYPDDSNGFFGLTWENGAHGDYPIEGYILQYRNEDGSQSSEWITKTQLKFQSSPSITIGVRDLTHRGSRYSFRVMAYNNISFGIPTETAHSLLIPDRILGEQFYNKWWFLVIIALCGIILIIVVVAVLMITGRRRYIQDDKSSTVSDGIVTEFGELNMLPTIDMIRHLENGAATTNGLDPGGTVASRASRGSRASRNSRRSRRSRRSRQRTPPRQRRRQSMTNVTYSDDDTKPYPESDSSTLSEKPSHLDSDSDDDNRSASDHSYNDNRHAAGHSALAAAFIPPNNYRSQYSTSTFGSTNAAVVPQQSFDNPQRPTPSTSVYHNPPSQQQLATSPVHSPSLHSPPQFPHDHQEAEELPPFAQHNSRVPVRTTTSHHENPLTASLASSDSTPALSAQPPQPPPPPPPPLSSVEEIPSNNRVPVSSHYMNNEMIRQHNWLKQQQQQQPPQLSSQQNAYSYTDSESESQSGYGAALGNGHVIMTNRPGSRAPLHGYSSFV